MGKSLKFDRVVDFDYLSAYEVIEKLVERFGVEDVQNALNEIAAQQSVQRTRPEHPPAHCKCGAKDGRHAAWCN